MKRLRAVGSALAAASGLGFASGRGVVLFYSQTGWASWIGVMVSSVVFAGICALVCFLARQTGTCTLPSAMMRIMGRRMSAAASALYGLMTVLVAYLMIVNVGNIAALTLPLHGARWMGMLAALASALILCIRGMRGLRAAGNIIASGCCAFLLAIAADPSPVIFHRRYETVAELTGNIPAAVVLAVLHGSLCGCVAAAAVASFSNEVESIRSFALCAALGMLILLSVANAAVLRGGEKLLSQAFPNVLMAARWGKAGFYGCAIVMWITSTATLAGCIGGLIGCGSTTGMDGRQPR